MKCPRCGADMTQPTVDVGVGAVPVGPYGCDECHWIDGFPEAEQLPDARNSFGDD